MFLKKLYPLVKNSSLNIGLWAAIISAFASSWIPILVRGNEFGSIPLVFWRLFGVGVLCLIILHLKGGRLNWHILRYSLLGGIAYVFNSVAFFAAIKTTSIVNVTVIMATAPIFLLWIASRVFAEQINRQILLATILAIVGAVLVLASGEGGLASRWGDLLAIMTLLAFLWRLTVSRRVIHRHLTALEFMTGYCMIGALLIFPIALLSSDPIIVDDLNTWLSTILLIVVVGLAHFLADYSHNYISLKLYSLLGSAADVVTVVWAWLFFDEQLENWQWLGTPMVAVAVIMALLDETPESANLPKKTALK